MKNNVWTKVLSALLALVMVVGMVPATAISAFADGVSETLVSSLAELYDGDEAKAREELEALYDAGLIDSDGNMVSLDIREDGESVDLEDIAKRIADGEEVGELTVNGNAAEPEKLTQLQQVNDMLEVLRLIDKDVQITDEHIANLQSLLEGIADGSIDISDVISRGEVSLSTPKRTMRLLGATNTEAVPTPNTGSGEVETPDGEYTGSYISDSTYEKNYSFMLADPDNAAWYSDSLYSDAVITLSCNPTATANSTLTVTATLNEAQPVPVSFDWAAVATGVTLNGDTSGTVTWEANDEQLQKTFYVRVGAKPSDDYWNGARAFVINAGNVNNAAFADGNTVWSQTVTISARDTSEIKHLYPGIDRGTYNPTGRYVSNSSNTQRIYYITVDPAFGIGRLEATFDYEVTGGDSRYLFLYYNLSNGQNQNDRIQYYGGDNSGGVIQGTIIKDITDPQLNTINMWYQAGSSAYSAIERGSVSNVHIIVRNPATHTTITGVEVPAGTYYSGQIVPVTIQTSEFIVFTENTKLMVNGEECPLLDGTGIESNKFTFGYTVKDTDSGALNVTGLVGDELKNAEDKTVSVDGEFPTASFGANDGVILSSDVKSKSLDWDNAKYGIDDAAFNDQTVTVVIPFKSGANKNWVTNEAVEINPTVPMSVPGFENASAGAYLRSAYLSTDDGATRYPVYVLSSGNDEAAALAVRFVPTVNATPFLRRDTLSFYLDTDTGTKLKYLGTWEERQEDAKGFAYFTATENSAYALYGVNFTYFVKGFISFDPTETVDRPNYDGSNIMKNDEGAALGFYKDGAVYVAVQGEDYSRQHDVELVANEALYQAAMKGARVENGSALILNYQTSGRKNFTFTSPENFSWSSSNEQVATVVKNEESGAAQIVLTGVTGTTTITLTVGSILDDEKYDLTFTFTVLEGKTPFLIIPEFSRERVTLTDTDTDVPFTSNLTQRNAAGGADTTTFTAQLYKGSTEGEMVWEGSFESTIQETITHITVPGTALTTEGTYVVVISTEYKGGESGGRNVTKETLSAAASLTVKQAPVKITLKKLESYSIDYDDLSKTVFTYTLTPSDTSTVVEYTIQKSGETVSERKTATGGVIPFAAEKPSGLKDAYTITVYARSNENDPWSVDSMLIRVYNMDTLDLIVKDVIAGEIGGTTDGTGNSANGTTVTMDNHGKVESYPKVEGKSYQLSVSDLNALRTDMSLQKMISVNYGSGVWGLLSDKMQWESSDSDLVSVNYKQGGFYSDIQNYSYTSYGPATDFLLVGKDKTDGVTITATHAGTGKSASVTVKADTLKDQLYVFQFNPKVETDVVYTNGAGEQRTLKSDANGVLAVYEPKGIASSVMVMSTKDGQTYVGTIFANELQSGERDIASLKLYPCNNLRLRSISNATLTFRNPDGSVYNGEVTLRAGVYKNGVYCPAAKTALADLPSVRYGQKDDITAFVSNGKVTLGFNPTEFKNNPDNANETGAYPGDIVTFVVEYRVAGYKTGYAMLHVSTDLEGENKAADSVIQLKAVRDSENVPQITRQTIRQYSDDVPVPYTRDVTDYTDNIGISRKFNKVVLTTDFVVPGSIVSVDAEGNASSTVEFSLNTVGGRKLTSQNEIKSSKANIIRNLSDMDSSVLFAFPFSTSVYGRSVYTMTDEYMVKDGISDLGENPVTTSRVKAMFVRDGLTVMNATLPFGISNLSHQQDLTDPNSGVENTATDIRNQLKNQMNIGEIFKSINVNEMLQKGFTFLSGLATGGDTPFSLMILPTENPGVFRIIAFVGRNQEKNKGNDDGVHVEYDASKLYEDYMDVMEDDDDDDDSGEASYDVSFSGTLVLEAGYDFSAKKWKIDFRGGKVGLGFSVKYEWSQNFICGPIPANISFEVGANAVLEVSFASKSSVKLMLVDATVGVYIEAFAGLGFDASIAKLKLGIYGRIGADVNFLLLSDFKNTSNGTKLDINGEIGIRLEVKLLFVKYNKTFASTGFNWSKKWNKYDAIQSAWEKSGSAELFGFTQSGRAYSMRLLANGKALVTIEGGGEIEDRDYLELAERSWNDGAPSGRRLLKAASPLTNVLTNVQTNAYPYSNPVLVDDGSMFLYISDNNNANEVQSVVSYAVKGGSGYTNMGALDKDDTVLADSDVVASGSDNKYFAAWVKQQETPEKEMHDATTYDDLGMMLNATEIYAGTYSGGKWTTTRLTTNSVADMSPTVASSGNRAIIAWRSLSATSMPEEGGKQDITAMFNAENNVNYRIYNGSVWTEAQVAYNGAAGTVNAIDSAMLSDGTAILVYTVRTGEDVTTTETFYTLIGTDGKVLTTGRLTNDSCTDTNVQVTTVGNQFVLGWYSEHDADETGSSDEPVVAHDIRLARINANGSVDADFPESIGSGSASDITSDFRFSAPANNGELKNVSIVWSQLKDSEIADDAGKYELNAMRFYEVGGAVGVSSATDISETAKNTAVDYFDAYTDQDGMIHVIVLASDYNSIEGISDYDTIDLSNLPIVATNDAGENTEHLKILEQEPIADIKLGSGAFEETAVEVTAETNLYELVPGLDLPVQFTIKNTGASMINNLTVQLGSITKTVEGVSLLPNESAIITLAYPVPENKVEDTAYTVTADGTAESGTLVLNRPDVGIAGIKLLREEDGERDIQVTLNNASGIPLKGSGKTVKLGLYTSADHKEENRVGEIITITDASAFADIDDGIYGVTQTIDIEKLIDGADEIPDDGIQLYAYAWIENADKTVSGELYSQNNSGIFAFKGLLTKNEGELVSADTSIEAKAVSDSVDYTVYTDIRNNSMQKHDFGIPVVVIEDSEGNEIAKKNLLNTPLVLEKEARRSDLSVTFSAEEMDGKTPARAVVRYIMQVAFDLNGGKGEFITLNTDLGGHIKVPKETPTPPIKFTPVYFDGWFTDPTGGERVTNDYVFTESTTIYAHYTTHQHSFVFEANGDTVNATCVSTFGDCTLPDTEVALKIVAPQRATGFGMPDAEITGATDLLGTPEISYYTVAEGGTRGTELAEPPASAGKYWAEFTLGEDTGSATAHIIYEIPGVGGSGSSSIKIPNYTRITDPDAFGEIKMGGQLEALVWIYVNEDKLKENTETDKYIIIGKRYMQKPANLPENYEWPYDDNTEYAYGYKYNAEGYKQFVRPASEIPDIISNGSGDVYIVGSDITEIPVNTNFAQINSTAELEYMTPCTELDALTWLVANPEQQQQICILVLGSEESEYEVSYRYIQSMFGDIMIGSDNAGSLGSMNQDLGYPLYIASTGAAMDPNETFTVTYDANEGTGTVEGGTYYVRSEIHVPSGEGLTKENERFSYWTTDLIFDGDIYYPGDILTVTENVTLYAVWEHAHSWKYSFDENSRMFTATCLGCGLRNLTLEPAARDKVYDGKNAEPYFRPVAWNENNELEFPTVTFYSGGEPVPEAKDVGTYTAVVSMAGHQVEVGEFHITPRPIVITADDKSKNEGDEDPRFTASYEYVEDNLRFENDESYPWEIVPEGDRVYAKSGSDGSPWFNTTLTLNVTLEREGVVSFDYMIGSSDGDNGEFRADDETKLSVSGLGSWQTFSCNLPAGSHILEWSYVKNGGYGFNGDFFAVDNIAISSEGPVTQDNSIDSNAELDEAISKPTPAVVEDSMPDYIITREEGEDEGTYTINITPVENHNYEIRDTRTGTLTILKNGEKQTITVSDVSATYGDTDKRISATTSGDGALSYAVKKGSDNYIDVDEATGALTIKKVPADGKAYVTVTAAKTETYTKATKDVLVTISKASINPTVTIANWTCGTEASTPSVRGNTGRGAVTYSYKAKDAMDDTYTETVPTDGGEYTVRAQIAETDNYLGGEATADFSIITKLAQTISASDVTATYGDTGKSVSATTNGNGAISYQVKTGNDVVKVNASTGALTILKAGTATITVIAKETDDFAAATAEITVTVSKAAINPTVTIADWNYGEEASAPSVEGNTGNGAVTFSYKVRNAADDTFTTTVPTEGGEYTVRAQIAETDNYLSGEATADFSIIVKPAQTINADNVTATYGDTDKSVNATTNGNGAISYTVKSGSDVVSVDENGNITIAKAGTAVVTITAAGTEEYAAATAEITVTVNKAAIDPTVTIANWSYGTTASTPSVEGNTGNGAVTYTYKVKGAADSTYTATVPTEGGEYTVRAQIAETDNFLGGTVTADFSIIVKPAQTITASDITATYGDAGVKISATLTTGNGALSYEVKSGDAVTVDENGNITIAKAGTAVVTITAAGTDDFAAATKDVTVTIDQATPTYTVPTNLTATYGQTLADVALPNGWAWANGTASVGNAGSHTFKATYTPTDTNYKAVSDIDVSVEISKANPVANNPTGLSASYGDKLSSIALTNPSGNTPGTWEWMNGDASVGDAGHKTFNAKFTPNDTANYNTLMNIVLAVTVNKIDYTGEKTASVNLPAFSGRTVTVTLPALPDGASYGTVTSDNASYFTAGAIENGSMVITSAKNFDEGTESEARTFTVAVTGATNYNDYTVTVTVTPEFKPVQVIEANNITAIYGDTGVKLEAEVTTGDGALSYEVKSGDAVTVDENGNLTIVKAGTAVVTITAAETDAYAKAAKDVNVMVGKKALTITADSASKAFDGTALTKNSYTVTGLVNGDSIESVTVTGSQNYVGSSSNVASEALIKRGETDVTANYNVSYLPGTLAVTSRTDDGENKKFEITVEANSGEFKYDGSEHTVSGFKTLEFTFNGVTFTVSGLDAYATGTDAAVYTAAVTGTPVVKDSADTVVTDQFIVNTVPGTLTIGKRSVTLTSATQTREYNGSALTDSTVTVTGDGWASGEGATYTVTGIQRLVGFSANSFTYEPNVGTNAENYVITKTEGTLTVTSRTAKYEISPRANSSTVKYDGTEKTASGFETNSFTVDGNTYTVSGLTAEAKGTDAGNYTVAVSGTAAVKDSYGVDVTSQFSVTPQTGTLTIEVRNITLTSATASKEYDGTALTDGEVTVTGDGFADGEGAAYTVTGTRTLAGTSENTFTYALNTNTKANNYNISTNNGTLTVNNRDTKYTVTLVGNSGEFKYDGSEKNVTGWTIGGTAGGSFTAENGLTYIVSGMTATLTKTDAGTYDVTVTGTPVVKDSEGNDVTAQFTASVEKGTLKIGKRSVTLTSATDSKAYDGTALTNSKVTVTGDGFAAGEGADFNVTGSQKLPGYSANAFDYALNGAKAANYEITKTEGTLTITDRTDEGVDAKYAITVKANSGTFTYDGKEHTVEGFENLEFSFNGVTYTVSGLTATVTGTNAGTYKVEVSGTPVVKDGNNNVLTEQFNITTVDGTLTINKAVIADGSVTLDGYKYGGTVSTPKVSGTLIDGDTTKSVTYYYKATAFLKSETENVNTLASTKGIFTEITATTFEPGTHYVLAVISGNNYSNTYAAQSAFEVTKSDATRKAPATPTVDGKIVTVAEADRAKSLEYSLDNGTTWKPVTLNDKGEFTVEWATPVTNAALKLRETVDERYTQPSEVVTGAAITTTTITATYDANGGVNAPAAETVLADRGITVAGRMSMTRKGYTFTGWNTEAKGTGTAYKAGDKLSTGITLYAQWTANTYKVRFNANGGTGTMGEMNFIYDVAQALTANAFEREEYNFLGWAKSENGSVQYQNKQNVENIAENGTVTLYAVWAKDLYNITGKVLSAQTGDIAIKLVQGNNVFVQPKTVKYDTANEEAGFAWNGVPAGTYNLIAAQDDVTMTVAVIITDGHVDLGTITMPTGNTSSVVNVSGDNTPAVVVGGLEEVAAAEEIDDRKVEVAIAVEAKTEDETGEAGETITKESRAQNVEFMDFTVTKTISNNKKVESVEKMTETSSVIELVIPFDFSGKSGVKLYRYHDYKAEALTERDSKLDGTFRLDRTAGLIYVYTSRFSTYAIAYNSYTAYSGGVIVTEPEKKVKFVDVPENSYYAKAVDWAVEKGITNGVDENHFAPDATCTRAQAVTFLWRALGCPEPKATKSEFTDVAEGAFYFKAVLWAAENGVTNGYGDGKFGVNDTVNRAQMVTFMERAMKGKANTAESFTDIPEGAYYADAAAWAKENGISTGIGEGKFGGETDCLRAQIVTMLYRYFVK